MFEILTAAEFVERAVAAAGESPKTKAAITAIFQSARRDVEAILESHSSFLAAGIKAVQSEESSAELSV